MKTRYLAAFVIFWVSVSANAAAYFVTGNKLYQVLTTPDSTVSLSDQGKAYGYIFAVHDLLSDDLVCTPAGVTGGQVTQVVKNYFAAHPEAWNYEASYSVKTALIQVWPCKK